MPNPMDAILARIERGNQRRKANALNDIFAKSYEPGASIPFVDEQAQALESRAAALFALSRHDDAVAAQREAVALFQQIYGGATRPAAQASLDRYLAAAAAAN